MNESNPRKEHPEQSNETVSADSSKVSPPFSAAAPALNAKSPDTNSQEQDDMNKTQTTVSKVLPSVEELKGKWKQQVGAAKAMWGKITEDELLKIEGEQQKLTGLIQQRYAISQAEAQKQVTSFFSKN